MNFGDFDAEEHFLQLLRMPMWKITHGNMTISEIIPNIRLGKINN